MSTSPQNYIMNPLPAHSPAIYCFDNDLVITLLHTVPKKGLDCDERRVVFDLRFPSCHSVNTGIPKDLYLNVDQDLQYPSVDDFANQILLAGKGCFLYKRDLSRANRQLPADPWDYRTLGFCILTPHSLSACAHLCSHVKEPQMI